MQELGQFPFLSLFFGLVSLGCAILSAASVEKARTEARKAQQALDELALVQDSLDVLRTAMKRTEGRLVKAAARAKGATDPEGEPDAKADPEGWKQWQNRRIFTKKANLQ